MSTTARTPRADAVRNRERVLRSAVALLSAQGPDVPFTAIAADAGVGVGTVYRHFPTRMSLIEAAYRSELDAVCDAAEELAAAQPAAVALRMWLTRFVEYLATKAGLAAALQAAIAEGSTPFAHSRGRLDEAMALLLDGVRTSGALRPGVQADDVLVLVSGLALATDVSTGREQRERLLDLLVATIVTAPVEALDRRV